MAFWLLNPTEEAAIAALTQLEDDILLATAEVNPQRVDLENRLIYGNDAEGQVDPGRVAISCWAIPQQLIAEYPGWWGFELPHANSPHIKMLNQAEAAQQKPITTPEQLTAGLPGLKKEYSDSWFISEDQPLEQA